MLILFGLGLLLVACSEDNLTTHTLPLAAPFEGAWQVAKPDVPGVISNVARISCDAPLILSIGVMDGDVQTLIYDSPRAKLFEMELLSFNDRITWIPPGNKQTTYIAEFKNMDVFWLYTAKMGKADWTDPAEYTRCKS